MTVSTPRRPGPHLPEIELDALLKRLHLANLRRVFREAITRAEEEQWSYRDFLALLVAEEVAHRKQTRLQRLTRRAHFPFLKTIDDFDFTLQSSLRVALLGSYLAPDFVTEGRSLIFHGREGRGKTHLAVAIGYRAIQNGFETLFTTAAQLIEDLSNASRHGRLHDALETYTHPHVLVIDEVGYITYGPDAANVLYHVVNDRHLRKKPMVFTTNKPMNAWGRVLHDPDLAAAILDRVLERGRWITLDGPSGRTRHLKVEGDIPQDARGARVSGKPVPEFPEPTGLEPVVHGEFVQDAPHVSANGLGTDPEVGGDRGRGTAVPQCPQHVDFSAGQGAIVIRGQVRCVALRRHTRMWTLRHEGSRACDLAATDGEGSEQVQEHLGGTVIAG